MNLLKLSVAAVVLTLAVGCAGNSASGDSSTSRAALKTPKFAPASAGNSLVVMYRNVSGAFGAGAMQSCTISIDGKAIGDLQQDHYATAEIPPGEHTLNFVGTSGVSNLLVTTRAGAVTYVQVTTTPMLAAERGEGLAQVEIDNEGNLLNAGTRYVAPAQSKL